jgi:hypothetical protein
VLKIAASNYFVCNISLDIFCVAAGGAGGAGAGCSNDILNIINTMKTGPFDIAELRTAVRDMNNDKAAGLDGYGIEIEKYIAGEQYLQLELEMYNACNNAGCYHHCVI